MEQQAPFMTGAGQAEEQPEGRYIYCIIRANGPSEFGPIGIGERQDRVYPVRHQGLAAVVSQSPVVKYAISRKYTIAHQKVLEAVMQEQTVLPVRFGTIAESTAAIDPEGRIRTKVLSERCGEFEELLARMDNKVELGVKVLWVDLKAIFQEVVEENGPIKRLKEKLMNRSSYTQGEKAHLGELVKQALDLKRTKAAEQIMAVVRPKAFDTKVNKCFGDGMLLNAAFLVEKPRVQEFDAAIDTLAKQHERRMRFKYVGPVPPCNFVELVISWQ